MIDQFEPLVRPACVQGECDSTYGKDFQFTALETELVVGEIYVRVYNEQPTFVLEVSGHGSGVGKTHWGYLIPLTTGPNTVLQCTHCICQQECSSE